MFPEDTSRSTTGIRGNKLARENFEKLERPYIHVFDVMLEATNPEVFPAIKPNGITYDVANVGRTPATIDNVLTSFAVSDLGDPLDVVREDSDYRLFISDSLRAEQKQDKIRREFDESDGLIIVENHGRCFPIIINQNDQLFFRIEIHYSGPFSSGHVTSGCWRFDHATNEFVRSGHERYNYVR